MEEVRLGKLKNGKAASKDEITGDMIKNGGDGVVDWIWRLCNTEEELKAMMERFVEVFRRRELKDSAGNNKMMVLIGEEGLSAR